MKVTDVQEIKPGTYEPLNCGSVNTLELKELSPGDQAFLDQCYEIWEKFPVVKYCESCGDVEVVGCQRYCEVCKTQRKRESNKRYREGLKVIRYCVFDGCGKELTGCRTKYCSEHGTYMLREGYRKEHEVPRYCQECGKRLVGKQQKYCEEHAITVKRAQDRKWKIEHKEEILRKQRERRNKGKAA